MFESDVMYASPFASVSTDNSSGAFLTNIQSEPVGDTYRGLFSSWFNAGGIADEDWKRNEQAANNQFYRDLAMQNFVQDFNANEAKKARDFSERMSNTAYQRAVADMQKAGINPILAFSNGGSSTPSGPSASSSAFGHYSSNRSSGQANTDSFVSMLVGLGKIAAGIYSGHAHSAMSGVHDVFRSVYSSYDADNHLTGRSVRSDFHDRTYDNKK